MHRIVGGLLIVLMAWSGSQPTLKTELRIENVADKQIKSKNGLLIEHGGYRGSGYTDSLGKNYNIRHNPITITNDTTVSIHVQIAFSKEYDYPIGYGDEQFKIFPLPKEWARERTTDSMYNSMFEHLPAHISNPVLNELIKPGEQIALAIGIIYPKPAEMWWVVPNELFAHNIGSSVPTCEFPMSDMLINEDPSSNHEIVLGLKLHLDERCIFIHCGQISYLDH